MKTAQQVFDKVVKHLRKQGRKSQCQYAGSLTCMYRGPNGLRCAAGCLITNKDYRKSMEACAIYSLCNMVDYNDLASIQLIDAHKDLVTALQETHDDIKPSRWESIFKAIAKNFDLKYIAP